MKVELEAKTHKRIPVRRVLATRMDWRWALRVVERAIRRAKERGMEPAVAARLRAGCEQLLRGGERL